MRSIAIFALFLVASTGLSQINPVSAQDLAADLPPGVEVITSLETVIDRSEDPPFFLKLIRITLQPGEGVAAAPVAYPQLLLIESGTLAITDELGIQGDYSAGNHLVIQPETAFSIENGTSVGVSLYVLAVQSSAEDIQDESALFAVGESIFIVELEPGIFPAKLMLAQLEWGPAADSGFVVGSGPLAFRVESGSLMRSDEFGSEIDVEPGITAYLDPGMISRLYNTEQSTSTVLMAGLIPVGTSIFEEAEGVSIPSTPTPQPSNTPTSQPTSTPTSPEQRTAPESGESMYRGNPAHTGEMPGVGPDPGGELTILWSFQTGNQIQSTPAIVDGVLYFGSTDGYVYAVGAETGAEIWRFQTGDWVSGSPAVVDGVVYIGSYDANVYALDARDGSVIWKSFVGNSVSASPSVWNDSVYIVVQFLGLVALEAETGAERWRFASDSLVRSSPAVDDGVVYVGGENGFLFAVNSETGSVLWQTQTGGEISSSPAVADGSVFVGNTDGKLLSLDAVSGDVQWQFATADPIYYSPAVANGVVFVGSNDDQLYALDAASGTKLWSTSADGDFVTDSVVADGVVYVGNADNNLHAYDAVTGEQLWQIGIEYVAIASPVVANGVVYIGSADMNLYAIGSK